METGYNILYIGIIECKKESNVDNLFNRTVMNGIYSKHGWKEQYIRY